MSAPTPLPTVGGLRLPGILYLVGLLSLFLGERVIGGVASTRFALDGVGVLLVLGALALFAKSRGDAADDQKAAHQVPLVYGGLGLLALLVYALGVEPVVDVIGFGDEQSEHRYGVVVSALWPLVLLAGVLPMLAADRVLASSPVQVVAARVTGAGLGALSLALAVAILFPLNYLASEYNQRWDFGYFKTAQPGTSTQALVSGLDAPVRAYLFFPTNTDVREEVRTYFDQLEGSNFEVVFVDHALEPELAKELKVKDNGNVVFARGEGDELQTESVKVGTDFDKARRRLKKLDAEVREALIQLARDKRTIYFTVGHGELYWDSDTESLRKINTFKRVLTAMNFRVKELGLTDGLATEVPEDADVVVVAGPTLPMMDEELASLDAFRRSGGALWILGEPDMSDMSAVLEPIGVAMRTDVTLTTDQNIIPLFRADQDKHNLVTNKYSTHASVTTLSRNSDELAFLAIGAAAVDETAKVSHKRTVAMRTLSHVWADDGNYKLDTALGEKRQTYNLVVAASGPGEGDDAGEWRALVMGDATWSSDPVLDPQRLPANAQFMVDAVAWLAEDEALAGTVESEEDIKIEHSKEGQGWIFYGTAFIVPLGLLTMGAGRIRMRKASQSKKTEGVA